MTEARVILRILLSVFHARHVQMSGEIREEHTESMSCDVNLRSMIPLPIGDRLMRDR